MSLPNGSQEGVKVSPVVKGAILVCVAAVIGLVMVFAARNDGKQGGENNSSPTESASSTSSGNEETDKANEEDKKDPEYSEVYAKGQKQAEAYWNDRFLECDKGRWFSVEETETGRRYLELRIDRLGALAPFIVTIPPPDSHPHSVTIMNGFYNQQSVPMLIGGAVSLVHVETTKEE